MAYSNEDALFYDDSASDLTDVFRERTEIITSGGKKTVMLEGCGLFYKLRIERTAFEPEYSFEAYREQIGASAPYNEEFRDFDPRRNERSPVRFSPYFRTVRRLNANTQLYTEQGFYPERYNPEHPIPLDDERYGILLYTQCEDFRKINIDARSAITLFSDSGEILLEGIDSEYGSLFLKRGIYTGHHYTPLIDSCVKQKIDPVLVTTEHQITAFDENIGLDGGGLVLSYESRSCGTLYGQTRIELTLCKSKCEPKETVFTVYDEDGNAKLRFRENDDGTSEEICGDAESVQENNTDRLRERNDENED